MCSSRVFPQGDLVDSRQISSPVIKVFCLEKNPALELNLAKFVILLYFLA